MSLTGLDFTNPLGNHYEMFTLQLTYEQLLFYCLVHMLKYTEELF